MKGRLSIYKTDVATRTNQCKISAKINILILNTTPVRFFFLNNLLMKMLIENVANYKVHFIEVLE